MAKSDLSINDTQEVAGNVQVDCETKQGACWFSESDICFIGS